MTFQFESLHDFLHMGGYAYFVWLSYGMTFFSMLWILLASFYVKNKIQKRALNELQRIERIKTARRERSAKRHPSSTQK